MGLHLTPVQLRLLLASILVFLAFLILVVYLIHRLFKERRTELSFHPKAPRAEDETGFAMATMQGVIAKMKEQERELKDLRRAAEQRARESTRLSENIIREMPSGVLVFDRAGFITTANPAVRAILGIDTWSRRRYPEILGPDTSLAKLILECLEGGKTLTREAVEYRTAQGDMRTLGMSLSPFHGPTGAIEGAVCLLTDLTETRRLQEQVRVKEHLAALGSMSAGIAHEFKNSLATISGYAQLLRDAELPPDLLAHAERIVHEIRSLTQVVAEFLALSKPLQIAAQPVAMHDLLQRLVDDFQAADQFKHVDFRLEGEFGEVEGDEVLLRQAFMNLLRNACEAIRGQPDNSRVTIRGEPIREGEVTFLSVRVSDTGSGIASEDQDKIFLPFYTTKQGGTGLGLALVQKIIVTHNGRVSLERSGPGGTTFTVLLRSRLALPAGITADAIGSG